MLDRLLADHLLLPEVLAEHEGHDAEVVHILSEQLEVDACDLLDVAQRKTVFLDLVQDVYELKSELVRVYFAHVLLTGVEQIIELVFELLPQVLNPLDVFLGQIAQL